MVFMRRIWMGRLYEIWVLIAATCVTTCGTNKPRLGLSAEEWCTLFSPKTSQDALQNEKMVFMRRNRV